ncbi:MAG: hypothetical protein AAGH89_05645 [Verrucomicrobiota bacterium]
MSQDHETAQEGDLATASVPDPQASDPYATLNAESLRLARVGRFDEARGLAKEALRQAANGSNTTLSQFIACQMSMADVLRCRGELAESIDLLIMAVDAAYSANHELFAKGTVALAHCIHLAGQTDLRPSFDGFERFDRNLVALMIDEALLALEDGLPSDHHRVLGDLADLVPRHLGYSDSLSLQILTGFASFLQGQTDYATMRVDLVQLIVDSRRKRGEDMEMFEAMEALALAQTEAGLTEDAESTYQELIAAANGFGAKAMESEALRNFGMFLRAMRRPTEESIEVLLQAVQAGIDSRDKEVEGRARSVFGVFLTHLEEIPRAKLQLTRAVALLPPEHGDAILAEDHLQAMEQGRPCSCMDSREELAAGVQAYILERVPEGVISSLHVQIDQAGRVDLGLEVTRSLSEEEVAQLEQVSDDALAEFSLQTQPGLDV